MISRLEKAIQYQNIREIKELLGDGVQININEILDTVPQYDILSKTVRQTQSIEIVKLLLDYGANPVFINSDGRTALSEAIAINRKDIASLLLRYGARVNISSIQHPYTLFFIQDQALVHAEIDMLKLLLDNGVDTCSQQDIDGLINDANDLSEFIWLDEYDFNKIAYLKENRKIIEKLLYSEFPPYLKLGEQDKYIIYENKEIGEEINIYLLADKQKHKDKKYLYADNKIDAFFYWCYQKELLEETIINVLDNYTSLRDVKKYTELASVMKNTIGEQLTTDIFNKEGKTFATSYFTVTHWWYNLHTDFNRLYQEENNRLPRAIKSQEEFDTLMKLLDIRYEQFTSGKDFNANQNKAELEALIEGREAPKREVDLSFLEEEHSNEILPEDFFKND